jgi:hypothetical protein
MVLRPQLWETGLQLGRSITTVLGLDPSQIELQMVQPIDGTKDG